MSNLMTLRPLYSSFLGFDRLLNDLEHALNVHQESRAVFPPYNVLKDGTGYIIEMALAGFKKSDISIQHDRKKGLLTISGKSTRETDAEHINPETDDAERATSSAKQILKRGISARSFARSFNIADNFEVDSASMEDGILAIKIKEIIREEDKPRLITVE